MRAGDTYWLHVHPDGMTETRFAQEPSSCKSLRVEIIDGRYEQTCTRDRPVWHFENAAVRLPGRDWKLFDEPFNKHTAWRRRRQRDLEAA